MHLLIRYLKQHVGATALVFFLVGCAGTGIKDPNIIRQAVNDPSTTSIFVLRDTGFQGSAALLDVGLNGVVIGNLGAGETVTYQVDPGRHTLTANFRGISGVGVNDPVATFEIENQEKKFFAVSLRTGLLVNTLILSEISEDSYLSLIIGN